MNSINPADGLLWRGNWHRIQQTMLKAQRGEAITVAFLGGSITQGSLASTQDCCYASLVYDWWVRRFPNSLVTLNNAGIGATTSQYGVARVKKDVLNPGADFVLTEFAVNDENTEFFCETYEGLVRTVLSHSSKPALLLMNNARFDDGSSAEQMHLKVAKHYNVPMVSQRSVIFKAISEGLVDASSISPDYLHPNDEGHRMVADVIISMLERIYLSLDAPEADTGELPGPLTGNAYESSVQIKSYNASKFGVVLNGFAEDLRPKTEFLDIFSEGFLGSKVGDSLSLTAECTGIAIQYRKTINQPAPIARAVIDGDEEHAVILDANFDETWGDKLHIETIANHMPLGEHSVRVAITEAHEDDRLPFNLVSVIISR